MNSMYNHKTSVSATNLTNHFQVGKEHSYYPSNQTPINTGGSGGPVEDIPLQPKNLFSPLYRFTNLGDRGNTQIFSFIILPELIRGFIDDLDSKPFYYVNSFWKIHFERREPHLGIFLESCDEMEHGVTSKKVVDFSFTVENREHYSRNESFELKQIEFNCEQTCVGRKSFIELADLSARKFLFDDGKCLVKLEMKNVHKTLKVDFKLAIDPAIKGPFGYKTTTDDKSKLIQVSLANGDLVEVPLSSYQESGTISCGQILWKVALGISLNTKLLKPPINASQIALELEVNVFRVKVNKNQNIWYKMNFCLELPGGMSTGPLNFIIGPQGYSTRVIKVHLPDPNTKSEGIDTPPVSVIGFLQCCQSEMFKTRLILERIIPMSIVEVPLSKNSSKFREMDHMSDHDGNEWFVHGESGGKLLRIGLLPKMPSHQNLTSFIPHGHVRKIGYILHILPKRQQQQQQQQSSNVPKHNIPQINENQVNSWLIDQDYIMIDENGHPDQEYLYYRSEMKGLPMPNSQEIIDSMSLAKDAITFGEVAMNIPFNQVINPSEGYMNPETGRITVQIEWIFSHLLVHNKLHPFDDLSSLHLSQMKKEIIKLQMENQHLEKQLVISQLANNSSSNSTNSGFPNRESDISFRTKSQMSNKMNSSEHCLVSSNYQRKNSDQNERYSNQRNSLTNMSNQANPQKFSHHQQQQSIPSSNRDMSFYHRTIPQPTPKNSFINANAFEHADNKYGGVYPKQYYNMMIKGGNSNNPERYRSWNNEREPSPTSSYRGSFNNRSSVSGYHSDMERGRGYIDTRRW